MFLSSCQQVLVIDYDNGHFIRVIKSYYSDSVEHRAEDQLCCDTLGKHHLHRAVYSLCVTGPDKNEEEWREGASLFYIILSVGRL